MEMLNVVQQVCLGLCPYVSLERNRRVFFLTFGFHYRPTHKCTCGRSKMVFSGEKVRDEYNLVESENRQGKVSQK